MSMLPDIFGPENRARCVAQLQKLQGYRLFRKPTSVAAVLIPLCIVRNVPGILFLRRPMHLRTHPGEVAFPGGKCDPEDAGDVVRTALRETFEEIGLAPESIDVWHKLPRMDGRGTLYPVLGFCGHIEWPGHDGSNDCPDEASDATNSVNGLPHRLRLNASEVSYILFRSFDWLCDPNNISYTEFRLHSTYFSLPRHAGKWDSSMSMHDIRPDQIRFRLPAYGALTATASTGPRIWGLTALLTYKVLRCLIPDGAYPSDSPIVKRLWRINDKNPMIIDNY